MLVGEIVDQAAYLRNDNPELLRRGLSGRQALNLFEIVLSEVSNYVTTYTGGRDRWGVPSVVHRVDLSRVNNNLLTQPVAPSFTGLVAPFDYPDLYVPLKVYNLGVMLIPLPTLTKGVYTFSMDTHQLLSETDAPNILVWNEGIWNVDYWKPAGEPGYEFLGADDDFVVSLRYPETDQSQRLTIYQGDFKIYGSFNFQGQIPPSFIQVQCRKPKVLGGFKLESGYLATPSRNGAQADLEALIPYQIDCISIDLGTVQQEGVIVTGDFPAEFEMTHNARKTVIAYNTDLGRVDTETKLALAYGLSSMIDKTTLDGAETPQTRYREAQYRRYKDRVHNRDMYQKGTVNWSLNQWRR